MMTLLVFRFSENIETSGEGNKVHPENGLESVSDGGQIEEGVIYLDIEIQIEDVDP